MANIRKRAIVNAQVLSDSYTPPEKSSFEIRNDIFENIYQSREANAKSNFSDYEKTAQKILSKTPLNSISNSKLYKVNLSKLSKKIANDNFSSIEYSIPGIKPIPDLQESINKIKANEKAKQEALKDQNLASQARYDSINGDAKQDKWQAARDAWEEEQQLISSQEYRTKQRAKAAAEAAAKAAAERVPADVESMGNLYHSGIYQGEETPYVTSGYEELGEQLYRERREKTAEEIGSERDKRTRERDNLKKEQDIEERNRRKQQEAQDKFNQKKAENLELRNYYRDELKENFSHKNDDVKTRNGRGKIYTNEEISKMNGADLRNMVTEDQRKKIFADTADEVSLSRKEKLSSRLTSLKNRLTGNKERYSDINAQKLKDKQENLMTENRRARMADIAIQNKRELLSGLRNTSTNTDAIMSGRANANPSNKIKKQGALLRKAHENGIVKSAEKANSRFHIGAKGKVGAVVSLLTLGGIIGNQFAGGHQTNAQLYNPNPQPQYYS